MRTNPKLKTYYPIFDYVRFIAASIVMFSHSGLIGWSPGASVAVDVFFALSGWLIGGILIRTQKTDLPRFYFNRAIRIWVPYFAAFLLIVFVSLVKDPITFKWFEFIFYKLTFVYNIFGPPQLAEYKNLMPLDGTGNHFWSVNAEEQFYLFAPILLVLLAKFGRHPLTWAVLSIIAWYSNLYAPIFLGVFAAVSVSRYGDFYEKVPAKLILTIVLIISIFGMVYSSDYRYYSPAFSISLVLLLAIKGKQDKVGEFLGGVSYPLYLNHWLGVFVANALTEPFGLRESLYSDYLAMIVGFVIGAVMYLLIDKQCLKHRAQLYTRTRGIWVTSCAYIMIVIGLSFGLAVR